MVGQYKIYRKQVDTDRHKIALKTIEVIHVHLHSLIKFHNGYYLLLMMQLSNNKHFKTTTDLLGPIFFRSSSVKLTG